MKVWIRQSASNVEPVEYNNGNDIVRFQAGAQPWTWGIFQVTTVSQAEAESVIEEYCRQGLKQHEYTDGYDEATKTLELK